MLCAMLNARPVNTCFYLLDYLASVGTRSNGNGEIVVGGIITFITRKFGMSEDQRINRIEGNNRLNIDTLIAMNFIKPHPPDNMTFELELHVPLCLIILPNPSQTNTEVEENLLYIGDDPHVHEEHRVDKEEGENLHHDGEQHDHKVSGKFDDDRWAWMQAEVQRISTEQQRQGVEMTGLRNDVLRGNHINE